MKPPERSFRLERAELDAAARAVAPSRVMEAVEPRQKRLLRAAATWLPVWCLVYLFLHAYEHAPVRAGRDAVLARLSRTAHFGLEFVFIVLPLCGLGLLAGRRVQVLRSPAFRATELASGAVALLLLVVHLGQVWLPRWAAGAPSAAYVGMLEATHGVLGAATVLLFLTAAIVHLGLAVVPALARLLGEPRRACVLSAVVCTGLWLWWVDLLSAYVASSPLL